MANSLLYGPGSPSWRRKEQDYISDQIRRQTDAMRQMAENQLGNYIPTQGSASNYVSTPENAKDPLIKRNKKLLLLTT